MTTCGNCGEDHQEAKDFLERLFGIETPEPRERTILTSRSEVNNPFINIVQKRMKLLDCLPSDGNVVDRWETQVQFVAGAIRQTLNDDPGVALSAVSLALEAADLRTKVKLLEDEIAALNKENNRLADEVLAAKQRGSLSKPMPY